MKSEDLIQTPSFVKRINEPCPKCNTTSIMEVSGKRKCGNCELIKAHKDAQKKIDDHYANNPDPLADYYESKKEDKTKSKKSPFS